MDLFFQYQDGNLVVTNWGLLAIVLIPGLIIGFRRGWQEEGFTAIGLGLAVSEVGKRFGEFLIMLANQVASVFPVGVALILGQPAPPSVGDIIPIDNRWAQLVAFVLMMLVAYRGGTILGRRRGVGVLGKLAGSIFGMINVVLILARIFDLSRPLENTQSIPLPTVTILGMQADMLNSIIYGLIAAVLALFLLLAYLQRRRAKE